MVINNLDTKKQDQQRQVTCDLAAAARWLIPGPSNANSGWDQGSVNTHVSKTSDLVSHNWSQVAILGLPILTDQIVSYVYLAIV